MKLAPALTTLSVVPGCNVISTHGANVVVPHWHLLASGCYRIPLVEATRVSASGKRAQLFTACSCSCLDTFTS
jgi:hypothetical protein